MGRQFLLPDLGEGLTSAEVVSWLVAPGDVVVVDQPVVEVESAKSIVELPSPYGGIVERLDAAPGQVVEKGSPLLTILDAAPAVDVVPGTALREDPADSGSGAVLIGYGTREPSVRRGRPREGRFGARKAVVPPPPSVDASRRSPVVSPIVRKLARVHGLDASQLAGSGPGSLVRREDVEAAIAAQAPVASAPTPTTEAQAPAAGAPTPMADVRTPLTGMRKLVANRLSTSRRLIPEATVWLDVDATRLFEAKARLHEVTGERFSLTALIARFTVAGLQKYPVLNSSLDDDTEEIVQHASINLGFAAQTSRGLLVPVVHDAQTLTLRELRDRVVTLVEASKDGHFTPSALAGGTFTLNNYGGFGVDGSAPIINHPEVAMLGIGRIIDRPWVVDGALAVRKVVTLSFVFDHRVCDGGVASGFLTYVAGCIEEPLLLLGDI